MKSLLNFVKKFKIVVIIVSVLIISFIVLLILFKTKPEIFNYKEITYKRNEVCNLKEEVADEALDLNLYQILGTTEYSEKIFIVNTFDVYKINLKSYKNKPAKLGDAEIVVKDCEKNTERTLNGRYSREQDYVVVYLEGEVFIFKYDKKKNILIDYNNNLKENNKIQYKLEKKK